MEIPRNHHEDCHFCIVNVKVTNRNNKQKWTYPYLDSVWRRVLHSEEIPITTFSSLHGLPEDDKEISSLMKFSIWSQITTVILMKMRECLNHQLDDLVCDLRLFKFAFVLFVSRLKEKYLLYSDTYIIFYRKGDRYLSSFKITR